MNFRASFRRAATSVRNFSKSSADFQPSSLWATYNRYLTEKPVLTKSITSGVIAFVGDVACQKLFPHDKDDRKVDWNRTVKFTILGTALVGPLLHYWYGFLVTKIPGTTSLATLSRVALDQLVFAPFIILPAIFSASQLMNGTPGQIPEKLEADWFPTVVANFALWVPAQFINFKFVAPVYQVLFANLVGLFWNVYLSAATNKMVNAPVKVILDLEDADVDVIVFVKDDSLAEETEERSEHEARLLVIEVDNAAARMMEEEKEKEAAALLTQPRESEAALQEVDVSKHTESEAAVPEMTHTHENAADETVSHKEEE